MNDLCSHDINQAVKKRACRDQVRLIAFFLPQFHPTPENDQWWGKGFTEWTNVTKAAPLFHEHYQPYLPTDLGFYDLRLAESRLEQIALAKEYGIDGFCYHYYWFSGTRILDKPLDAMLADPSHDMPFCLCWANENWTRRWDAAEHEILIQQKYLEDDDINFIKSLVPFFNDPRYIQHDGAPVLIVYRPQHLPDARKTLEKWRNYCKSIGIERLHLIAALTHGNDDYAKYGFDAGVEFPPHNLKTGNVNENISFNVPFYGNVMEYHVVAESYINRKYPNPNVYRTVFPSWDNTARTGARALIHLNGTPENYEYWLSESIRRTASEFPDEERYVFINAWNEWAEGCHLEPGRRYGRRFLESTLKAKKGLSDLVGFTHKALPSREVNVPTSFSKDISSVTAKHFSRWLGGLKRWINRFPLLRRVSVVGLSLMRRLEGCLPKNRN
jgi:lipopolysaccharide biosynthesis protein